MLPNQCYEIEKRSALASPDIRSDAPKDCTHEQTYVLPELEEGAFENKLVGNRHENESSYDLQISNSVIARSNEKKGEIYRPEIISVQLQVSLKRFSGRRVIRTRTNQSQRR